MRSSWKVCAKSKIGSGMQPFLRSLASGASQVGVEHSHTWCLWSWWVHTGLPRSCLAGTMRALVALVSDEARDEMQSPRNSSGL